MKHLYLEFLSLNRSQIRIQVKTYAFPSSKTKKMYSPENIFVKFRGWPKKANVSNGTNFQSQGPKNTFFYLGICSAIFLFFHVLFLGWDLDSELFKKLRRLIIVLFILFELLAQVFLTKDLYKNKKSLYDLCYFKIILVKVYFVTTICIGSLIIILGLMFFNYPSSVDYILEWNYFVILLIFYFLSSIMWKGVI